MDKTLVFTPFFMFLVACNKEQPVVEKSVCDCADLPVLTELGEREGTIYFPSDTLKYAYSILIKENNPFNHRLSICGNDVFLSQIRKGQITDSSRVRFKGGIINGFFCTIKDRSDTLVASPIKIKTIEKI